MLPRFQIFFFGCVMLLTVFIVLTWHSLDRQTRFELTQRHLEENISKGAARELNAVLSQLQEQAHIFTDEYLPSLHYMATHAEDSSYQKQIVKRLKRRFSDFAAFTLTNVKGESLLEEVEPLIGETCQADLQHYSRMSRLYGKERWNETYIHPQPFNYHFDIMTPWSYKKLDGVLLISLKTDQLAQVLSNYQLPGYQFMLVKKEGSGLIELTSKGSRDTLTRENHLTSEELSRIHVRHPISGSHWELVSLPQAHLLENYKREAWVEASIVMGIVFVLTFIMVFVAWRTVGRARAPFSHEKAD